MEINKNKDKLYSDMITQFYPFKYDKNKEPNKIQTPTITFQVTDACNLQCTYCYQINKSNHIMPIEVAQSFIDLLLDNNKNTQEYIDTSVSDAIILDFIGGEPFLQVDLIDKILDYFQQQTIKKNHIWQYNWRASISSNGTLYFEPAVQKFFDKWMDRVSFNISIDGNKQLHDSCRIFPDGSGSYDIAIKAVRHYVDVRHGIMGSKMTLAPQNIQYTFEAIKNFIDQKYTNIHLNCIYEKGWTYEHASILYYQLKQLTNYIIDNDLEKQIYISMYDEKFFKPKSITDIENWCGGNGQMIAVDWKGDIYPCIRYMESSLGKDIKPIIIGNVKTGIVTDQKCKDCVKLLKSINRITQSTEECIYCPIADGCSWCQAYNYQDSGNLNHRATYICCMHKARALANVYYWNMCFRKYNENIRFKLWLSDEESLKIIPIEELNLLKLLQFPITS